MWYLDGEYHIGFDSDDTDQVVLPEQEIMMLESAWSDRYAARDLEEIVSMFTDDTVLLMPESEPLVGIDAVAAATAEMLADESSASSWRSLAASVSESGDMAWDYGVTTTRMDDGSVFEGYYLVVWVREDGQWKIAGEMFN